MPNIKDQPLPTFSDSRDRLAFLVAEYKVPITATLLAAGVWAAWATPQVPDPPEELLQFSAAWGLLSMPSFFAGKRVVEWLYDPNMVNVEVVPGGQKKDEPRNYDAQVCPPAIWASKTVEGAEPLENDEGWADYVVTDWEWLEDVKELTVRGCERQMMEPGVAVADAEKVDAYYSHYVGVRNAYSTLKARLQEFVQNAHDDAMLASIKVKDKSLAPGVSAQEQLEEAEADGILSEELPTLEEIDTYELELPDEEPEPATVENGQGGTDGER